MLLGFIKAIVPPQRHVHSALDITTSVATATSNAAAVVSSSLMVGTSAGAVKFAATANVFTASCLSTVGIFYVVSDTPMKEPRSFT
jgi:hypothetical protein